MSPLDIHVFVLKHELRLHATQDLCAEALDMSQFLRRFVPITSACPCSPRPHPEEHIFPSSPSLCCAVLWLPSTDKTVKLWKVSERDKRPEGYNLKDEEGRLRDPATITTLRVSPAAVFGHCLGDSSGWPHAGCCECCNYDVRGREIQQRLDPPETGGRWRSRACAKLH